MEYFVTVTGRDKVLHGYSFPGAILALYLNRLTQFRTFCTCRRLWSKTISLGLVNVLVGVIPTGWATVWVLEQELPSESVSESAVELVLELVLVLVLQMLPGPLQ